MAQYCQLAFQCILLLVFVVFLSNGTCRTTAKISAGMNIANTISPRSITPPALNICEDFVHTLEDNDFVGVENETVNLEPREIIKDLLSEDWKRTIKKQYRKFIKKHIPCKTTEKKLKRQNFEFFFKLNHTKPVKKDSLMDVYIRASKISFILSSLKTDGVRKCCLQDKKLVDVYERFKNRVLANLYHTVSDKLSNWNETECTMSAAMLTKQPMRCEDITHMIAIILKDSLASVKHLWKRMKSVANSF